METAAGVAMGMSAAAILLAVVRLVRGPQILDRLVAFDLVTMAVIGLVAANSVRTGETSTFDVAAVVALVAFLATAAFASHFASNRGDAG